VHRTARSPAPPRVVCTRCIVVPGGDVDTGARAGRRLPIPRPGTSRDAPSSNERPTSGSRSGRAASFASVSGSSVAAAVVAVPLRCSRKLDRPRRCGAQAALVQTADAGPRSRACAPGARGRFPLRRQPRSSSTALRSRARVSARDPENQVNLDVTVRNVSRRRLEIAVDPAVRARAASADPPGHAGSGPGRVRYGRGVRRVRTLPPARRPVRRHPDRARVRCSVPCALGHRGPVDRQAVAHTAASPPDPPSAPSDANPAVLSVRRWCVDGTAAARSFYAASRSFASTSPRRPAARDDCTRPRPPARSMRSVSRVAGPAASHFPAGSIRCVSRRRRSAARSRHGDDPLAHP